MSGARHYRDDTTRCSQLVSIFTAKIYDQETVNFTACHHSECSIRGVMHELQRTANMISIRIPGLKDADCIWSPVVYMIFYHPLNSKYVSKR